jgi:hypothetical protein
MRTERRTDMTKLIVAFHNFAKAPKNPLTFDGSGTLVNGIKKSTLRLDLILEVLQTSVL